MPINVQFPQIDEPRFDDPHLDAWARIVKDAVNMLNSAVSATPCAEMLQENATDVYVINSNAEPHAFHHAMLLPGNLSTWTYDAGGDGTSHAITAIAAGSTGAHILVTTGTAHTLETGAIVSQTNLADAAYVGFFQVTSVPSTTTYEVLATFTATDTGTIDEAATLTAGITAGGTYLIIWAASIASVGANVVFDFDLHLNAVSIDGARVRRKFNTAGDVGSTGGHGLVSLMDGDKVAFAFQNVTNATNLTIRNFNLSVVRV